MGNMLTEAGYSLIESKAYIHKWPPRAKLMRRLGVDGCLSYLAGYMLDYRTWFQVRAVGRREVTNSLHNEIFKSVSPFLH